MNMLYKRRISNHFSSLVVIAALSLSACGGSQDSDQAESVSNEPLVGTFVDSAVSGLTYTTDTQSGVTNETGEFHYFPGETVTFSVGSVTLPSAPATAEMTPLDLSGSNNLNDPTVVNILQFLQTLDIDQDPDNGIDLNQAAALITDIDIDFSDVNFADQVAVQQIVANAPANTNNRLVDADTALQHFGSSLIMLADPPTHAKTTTTTAGDEFYIVAQNNVYRGDMVIFSRRHFALTVNGELTDGRYDTSTNVWHLWNRKQLTHQFVLVKELADGSLETCWAETPENAVACNEDASVAFLFTDESSALAYSPSEQGTDELLIAAAMEPVITADRETISLAAAQAESVDAAEMAVQKTEDELLATQMAAEAQEQKEAAELAAQQAEADAIRAAELAKAEEAAKKAAAEKEAAEIEAARVAALEEAAAIDAAKKAAAELAAAQAAAEKEAERLAAEKLAAEEAALAKAAAEQKAAEEAAAQAAAEKEAAELAARKAAEEEALAAAKAAEEREAAELAAAKAKAEAEAAAKAAAEKEAAEKLAAAAEAERVAAQLAAEKAEADRLAAEQAEAERLAEQAEVERLAAEKAEIDRLAAEQAEADRIAAEEAERLAAEQAEAERLATELVETEAYVDPSTVECDAPLEEFKSAILEIINNSRANYQVCGTETMQPVQPLQWLDSLQQAATVHSNDMAEYDFLSHTGTNGMQPLDRALEAGFIGYSVGENVAYGPSTVTRAHSGFMNSSGHCRNIMRHYFTHVGAACRVDVDTTEQNSVRVTRYWTVVFGLPTQ